MIAICQVHELYKKGSTCFQLWSCLDLPKSDNNPGRNYCKEHSSVRSDLEKLSDSGYFLNA